MNISLIIAIKVNFSQSVYSVDENSMNLEVSMIFSNPSSMDIDVGVVSTPHTVTGQWIFHAKTSKFGLLYFHRIS